jgi:hypothetical protein
VVRATQNLAERAGAKEGQNVDAMREVAAENQLGSAAIIVKGRSEAIIFVELVFKWPTKKTSVFSEAVKKAERRRRVPSDDVMF